MSNQVIIKVDGMTCTNCARSVESAIVEIGGSQISVNLGDKEVVFENPSKIPLNEIVETIEKRGYTVIREKDNELDKKKS